MTRHQLEVADVFREHGPEYLERFGDALSPDQRRVLLDIARCRTAVLGGHVEACDACGHQRIAYNSCRNRHCPKCQGAARRKWLEQRSAELLPVPYFHVVFTVPAELAPLALQNPRQIYGILFRAAAETLLQVAATPKHLGAQIGFLAVLHTWGQNLLHHPHLHCVIPGGGFAEDSTRWVMCRKDFFLPVRVLSRVFRGKFIDFLKCAFRQGKLTFHGNIAELNDTAAFEQRLNDAVRTAWVVYAKPPFGGPQQVLKYLARYTHRVAISNERLIACQDGTVQFRYKDYAHGSQVKTMTVSACEFIRRFLLHTLPRGFMKIRQFGFLANRLRTASLQHARQLLADSQHDPGIPSTPATCPSSPVTAAPQNNDPPCPLCGKGKMIRIQCVPPCRVLMLYMVPGRQIPLHDTS